MVAVIPKPVAATLPSTSSIARSLRRFQRKVNPTAQLPATKEDIMIPDKLKLTPRGDLFLLYSSEDNNIIIFTTVANLNILLDCDIWFSDGTFKIVPALFQQLYSIHGRYRGQVLPLIYSLLGDKKKKTYITMLRVIKEHLGERSPLYINVDFEIGYIKAVQKVFKDVNIHGCYFHFRKNLWEHVQDSGMAIEYSDNVNFALHIKMFAALSFVPVADVSYAYE